MDIGTIVLTQKWWKIKSSVSGCLSALCVCEWSAAPETEKYESKKKTDNEKREELVERMSVWIECVLLISSINYCKNINQLGAAREAPGEHSANGIDEN